ncbi:MAG: DUF1003 domain-containing protein [Acidimicrobiia bacterium]|nr:DUF1003 domain-containing protein [Acidimicrobiia bacterium]
MRQDSDLTLGERAADHMRLAMGSWTFVFLAIVFLAVWMLGNSSSGFDPYPFILLNLVLSCVAALQGAILLIAARRSDQIAAELALHDYETNRAAALEISEIHELVTVLHARLEELNPPRPSS